MLQLTRETEVTTTIPSVAAERSEAEALFEFHAAALPEVQTALGMNRTRLGGGVVTSMTHDVTSYWNKALGFGATEPVTSDLLAEIIAFYRAQQAPVAVIQIAPSQLPPDWPELCAQHGLREGSPWLKLAAPVDEVVSRADAEHSTLLCAPVPPQDAAQWGAVMMRGFGMPEPLYSDLAAGTATGHDHWYPHAVWLGSELVGTGTLAVRDGIGHMYGGAVLPHARQRGGQTALIGAGARMAQKLGCTALVAETGAEGPGEHNSSLHNMLRLGFTVQYERPNWIWTPDPS